MKSTNRIQLRIQSIFQGAAFLAFFVTLSSESVASKPLQLSLVPGIALHDNSTHIEGVSLGIWSENPQRALTLGLVNGSTGQSSGFSWAYLLNYSDSYTGVQWAPVNYTKGNFLGWQSGFVNYAGNLKGLQLGFLNYAKSVDEGVQIGVINLMPENKWFAGLPEELAPGMIFINWHF